MSTIPAPVLESMTELDKAVLIMVCQWMNQDPTFSVEMQGQNLGGVRPCIARNVSDNTYFIKVETREWSMYSKTNWWKGRAYRNSYEHPIKVVSEMIMEHWVNAAQVNLDETTEYTGG